MKSFFQVVVYLVLLLTCQKSSSGCKFEFTSITSYFSERLANVTDVLFNDYEVEVVSNFEQGYCSELWWTYDVYMMLNASEKKAEKDIKTRINDLLQEISFLKSCTFTESNTCTKHKQPLVQILQKLKYHKLENFPLTYVDISNCTSMRCNPGNAIALTGHPVDHHASVNTNYSNEGQDTGTVPNYEDFLQKKKSELSNNTALIQDKTPQTERTNLYIFIPFFLFPCAVLAVCAYKQLQRSHAHDNNMDESGCGVEILELEPTDTVDPQIDVP